MILVLSFILLSSVSGMSISHEKMFDVDKLEELERMRRSYWGYGPRLPCSYTRERKEVRQMSRREWKRFTDAVNALKKKGIYDDLAEMHRGDQRLQAAHGGPNFTGWHRILLLILEDLLRKEHPCITIPYWDSTLDYDMEDPTKSILWTEKFFGNGNMRVTSGPFANWVTGTGNNLTRNIGSGGTLITKEGVKRVLSGYNHSQIMDVSDSVYSLERIHNGPHVWVDGQMTLLAEASEDPVFYMHHAFIDCIWYWFQEKLWKEQGVDSFYDYPDPGQLDPHGQNHEMDPFAKMKGYLGITNRDGYRRRYYRGLYTCKPMPTCTRSYYNPSCGSPHLKCDLKQNRCISKKGVFLRGHEPRPSTKGHKPSIVGISGKTTRPTIALGKKFVSDVVDPRTSGDPLPQGLPDSNLRAISDRKILQKLAQDSRRLLS